MQRPVDDATDGSSCTFTTLRYFSSHYCPFFYGKMVKMMAGCDIFSIYSLMCYPLLLKMDKH